MNDSPFFSVIIPTYNRANFIINTINSVLSQTYLDFEVIVVDDCSTDDTIKILQPFIERREILLIRHDKNYERAKSRNTGMNRAKGKFVTFIDSDDLMYPSNLKDAYDHIQAMPNTKVFHNLFEFVDKDGRYLKNPRYEKLNNPIKNICTGNFLACIGVFVDRDLYKVIKFDENRELSGSEDWDYWLRIIAKFPKMTRINKVNNGLVEHSERTVNNLLLGKVIKRREYILKKIKQSKELSKAYKRHFSYMEASSDIFIASTAIGCNQYKSASYFLLRGIKKDFSFLFSMRSFLITKNIIKGLLFRNL